MTSCCLPSPSEDPWAPRVSVHPLLIFLHYPTVAGQKRRKGGQGRRENANRHLARKNSKEPGSNSRRHKGQQQPQPGTAGPITSVGPT